MPAFRAAGTACWTNASHAVWPEDLARPRYAERKKFCMSIITRADFAGEIVISDVVVGIVTFGPVLGVLGSEGCVRSKPVCEECSQKFEGVPIRALRWGLVGMLDAILEAAVVVGDGQT